MNWRLITLFSMKACLIAVILVLLPSSAFPHPGKTDRRGGHKCWKGCAEWRLVYKEYHLHAENFRPIRPAAIKTGILPAAEEPSSEDVTIAPVENKMPVDEIEKEGGREGIPTVEMPDQNNANYKADIWTMNPFLLSAALLLLLVLVLSRTSRRRNKEVK